jgi:hypothetical protein
MSDAKVGARVMYCGHDAYFVADIYKVGNTNVVRAGGPINETILVRDKHAMRRLPATHQLSDFPRAGFWRPDLGVFVVPEAQVFEIPVKPKRKQ